MFLCVRTNRMTVCTPNDALHQLRLNPLPRVRPTTSDRKRLLVRVHMVKSQSNMVFVEPAVNAPRLSFYFPQLSQSLRDPQLPAPTRHLSGLFWIAPIPLPTLPSTIRVALHAHASTPSILIDHAKVAKGFYFPPTISLAATPATLTPRSLPSSAIDTNRNHAAS